MEFNKIAVVGGGTMGNGIAHVFALKGLSSSSNRNVRRTCPKGN